MVIVPLTNKPIFKPVVAALVNRFVSLGIAYAVDSAALSRQKRYERNDELGTPLAICVDKETLQNDPISLRYRNDESLVRSTQDAIIKAVYLLAGDFETWDEVQSRLGAYPPIHGPERG